MKEMFKLAIAVLFTGMVSIFCVACGNSSQKTISESDTTIKYPIITENGVKPFVLGESVKKIPLKGEYYDTIILKKCYGGIVNGEHYVEVEKDELKYYDQDDWSFDFEPVFIGKLIVVNKEDTLMSVEYDKSRVIRQITVLSDKLQLENGIHVGLSSKKMFSKYNADFLTTDEYGGDSRQAYYVSTLSNNIRLDAIVNPNLVDGSTYYDDFENEVLVYCEEGLNGETSKFKCVKKKDECSVPTFKPDFDWPIYLIPSKYVVNWSLDKICITKSEDNIFSIP